MLDGIKNLIIVALTILAVSLTGKLWFEKISGHSFFYTFLSFFTPVEQDVSEPSANVKPYRIIVNFGNLKYSITYNNLEDSNRKKTADELITAVLQDGRYVGVSEFDATELLKNKAIIYEYPLPISSPIFVKAYVSKGIALSSKVRNVQELFIFPNRGGVDGIRLVFTENGKAHEYSLTQDSLSKKAMAAIQTIENENTITYVESSQTGLFSGNFFIPQITKDGYRYNALSMINPYMSEGGLLRENIKKLVAPFFNDSASIWADITRETIFTYSSDNTVVKYYPYTDFGVVEFFRYLTPKQRMSTSLYGDYCTALNFIARDKLINNEYYLARTLQEGDKRTFYFNYAINDFPLILSESCKQSTGLTTAIEITLENGWVTRYKKLAITFAGDSDWRTLDTDFVSAANQIADMAGDRLDAIKFSLDYIIDTDVIELDWTQVGADNK